MQTANSATGGVENVAHFLNDNFLTATGANSAPSHQPGVDPPLPLLITVDEAAKMLNLSRSKTYELTKTRQIPCVRIDRSVRVPLRALIDWIQAKTQESNPTDVQQGRR